MVLLKDLKKCIIFGLKINENEEILDFEVIGEKLDFISIDVYFICLKYIFENFYKILK